MSNYRASSLAAPLQEEFMHGLDRHLPFFCLDSQADFLYGVKAGEV